MAVLRLFASAREAAGLATAEIPGATVGDVLDESDEVPGLQLTRACVHRIRLHQTNRCNPQPVTNGAISVGRSTGDGGVTVAVAVRH